ncbi:MAG: response regulator, partial [Aureibaculum sp.]
MRDDILTRILIFFFLFYLIDTFAQIKLPPIDNFSVEDYKGGNQNWDIENDNGFIYVANNEGLLEFDGTNWYLNSLPTKSILRSVKVFGNRIYTGSYEEFGFWERSNTGVLNYTSLSQSLTDKDLDSQSIWEIFEFKGNIIFKSFSTIYVYENNQIQVIKPGIILMAAAVLNDRFIVHGLNRGLLELRNGKLEIIENTEELAAYRVQSIILLENDEILLGTSLHGCFKYMNNEVIKWDNAFNDLLKDHQLNTLSYSNGKLFAGTIKNGIYQYDIKNNSYINLNVKNGLQNNTVLASTIDDSNFLWLALDNGISVIPISFYAHYLNPYKEDIGAVYDIV